MRKGQPCARSRRKLHVLSMLLGLVTFLPLPSTAQVTVDIKSSRVTQPQQPAARSADAPQPSKINPQPILSGTLNATSEQTPSLPTDVGLYYRDGGKWIPVTTERPKDNVGKTMLSGLASGFTYGIKKAKWTASLAGEYSLTRVAWPGELVLYRSETADYSLIPLTIHSGRREFQVASGRAGLVGLATAGNMKGLDEHAIAFQCEPISGRVCRLKADLAKGEYVLTVGLGQRVYTFGVD